MTANAKRPMIDLFSFDNGREEQFLLHADDVENSLNHPSMN